MKTKPVLKLPEELPMLPACSDCAFSEMHEDRDSWFYCRKKSPSIVIAGGTAVWPVVDESDWCGEYKKAKDV
jgi:hypothetical protein